MGLHDLARALGFNGKNAITYLSKTVKKLYERGILTSRPRGYYARTDALLALAKKTDITKLSNHQIAQRVGYTGQYAANYVSHQKRKLRKRGLLPPKGGR